jgi:hypothetical protein
MRYLNWVIGLALVLSLSGCLESKPSDLAVEVMAKRYWADELKLAEVFPLQEVTLVSAYKEGADSYIAQVRYRVTASLSEAEWVARLQAQEAQGDVAILDHPGVVATLQRLPAGFTQQSTLEVSKRLQFRDGARGWLLERELTEGAR